MPECSWMSPYRSREKVARVKRLEDGRWLVCEKSDGLLGPDGKVAKTSKEAAEFLTASAAQVFAESHGWQVDSVDPKPALERLSEDLF